jgi:hypothetical protein
LKFFVLLKSKLFMKIINLLNKNFIGEFNGK